MPFLFPTCPNLQRLLPHKKFKTLLPLLLGMPISQSQESRRPKPNQESACHTTQLNSKHAPLLRHSLETYLSLSLSMEEPQAIILQINGDEEGEEEEEEFCGGGGGGDEFYEMIEAPKFVDLTKPDHHRPDHDDRFWFCLRVGLSLFLTLCSSQSFENFSSTFI